jgi:hypothetical protein
MQHPCRPYLRTLQIAMCLNIESFLLPTFIAQPDLKALAQSLVRVLSIQVSHDHPYSLKRVSSSPMLS